MITLYHCMSARSFRPLWMLEELGMPYQLVMLPFPPRVAARSYLESNPLGTIPLMIDGQTRMTESAAICQYLCAQRAPTPLQVEPAEAEFGAYLNYLHFGEATLTFPQTLVLRYSRFEPAERRQPTVAEDYAKWFLARLRTLEPLHCRRCLGGLCAAAGTTPRACLPVHPGSGRLLAAVAATRRLPSRPSSAGERRLGPGRRNCASAGHHAGPLTRAVRSRFQTASPGAGRKGGQLALGGCRRLAP